MGLSTKILTIFVFAVNHGHLVFGIKCWECRSDVDPACGDPFDNTTLAITDCDYVDLHHLPELKSTLCRKIRQKVQGEWRVIRSCGFLTEGYVGEGDCERRGSNEVYMETCTCTSAHGCNSSCLFFPTKFLLFILTLLSFAFVNIQFKLQ